MLDIEIADFVRGMEVISHDSVDRLLGEFFLTEGVLEYSELFFLTRRDFGRYLVARALGTFEGANKSGLSGASQNWHPGRQSMSFSCKTPTIKAKTKPTTSTQTNKT